VKPFRITWNAQGNCTPGALARNQEHAKGFPRVSRQLREHPVAVAGGGPLLDVEALRRWPGDIWAINHTADYLLDRGIDCTFFSVDPAPMKTTAAKRLLATCCDPDLFDGQVECFDLSEQGDDGVAGGTTTATRAPMLCVRMGYPGAVFFGCESSFTDRDHIDRNEAPTRQLIVRANGRDFRTNPQMLVQAQELSWFIKHSKHLEDRSGGLLSAMLADDEWGIVAVTAELRDHLNEVNGETIFDGPYIPEHA
jgi:hypothetical protein